METPHCTQLLSIGTADRVSLVKPSDVLYGEADGRFTIFHLCDGSTLVATKNLGVYEERLADHCFYRVHHKYLVNLFHVKYIKRSETSFCELQDQTRIPISKRRLPKLNRFLRVY
ncbi:MAG: LytTR family DNA-binding domain-containing protein [Lutibacter sp.]|nr:LytTR family DNA-binding domain-containing protein [Lutibacter sp.]